MPADLDAARLWPDVVSVVDHPVRQPQQALFDGLEVPRVGCVHGVFAHLLFERILRRISDDFPPFGAGKSVHCDDKSQ